MGSTIKIIRHGLLMRESFHFKKYSVAQWFPGHMGKGINMVHKRLQNIDCIIEVHDARIPISGRNPTFEQEISQIKPHILVLNKVDLIDNNIVHKITEYYKDRANKNPEKKTINPNIIFTNCKDSSSKSIKELIPFIVETINNSERYHRTLRLDYSVMIIGVPNVGKSSLINALRAHNLHRGKATLVGSKPGITRSILERIKISEDPLIYLLDTPGILAPKIKSIEVGLKLALVNTILEHLVGEDIIADYLLFRMNYIGNHKYVEFLNLDEPTDDIQKVLVLHALRTNKTMKVRRFNTQGGYDVVPNITSAAKIFIAAYRSGTFGDLRLDLES